MLNQIGNELARYMKDDDTTSETIYGVEKSRCLRRAWEIFLRHEASTFDTLAVAGGPRI